MAHILYGLCLSLLDGSLGIPQRVAPLGAHSAYRYDRKYFLQAFIALNDFARGTFILDHTSFLPASKVSQAFMPNFMRSST